jgi:hypothetical protein
MNENSFCRPRAGGCVETSDRFSFGKIILQGQATLTRSAVTTQKRKETSKKFCVKCQIETFHTACCAGTTMRVWLPGLRVGGE